MAQRMHSNCAGSRIIAHSFNSVNIMGPFSLVIRDDNNGIHET